MAAGTRVGTGYVKVVPDFSGFQEKVGAKLNETLGPAMDRAGKKAGQRLSKSIGNDSSLRAAFAPLARRFQREGDNLGEQLASRVGKGAKRAEGDMFGLADAVKEVGRRSKSTSTISKALANDTFGIARAAKDAGKAYRFGRAGLGDWGKEAQKVDSIGRRLSKGTASLARDALDVGRNLKAAAGGFGNFEGIMARANRGFQFLRNILGSLKLPTIAASLALLGQSLSALTAGAFAAASSLSPLTGALVALPALALAGAQAVGTLKLALSGIGDAVKAATAVQVQGGEQAVQTLRKQENAAEAVADAHRTLKSAERDAEYATEDLTKARKDATDQLHEMERASRESRLTEQEGSQALREARRELNKTLKEPASTGFDIRSAEQAVERARFGLEATREEAKKARKDFAEAQSKGGVSGMPEVVSARRAQADADRSVADAERGLAKAERENSDAMKQQGSAATALQQKMAALTPSGRKFARFLISLKPRYDELREVASKGFFPGAESGIKSALKNFGVLKGIVGETAGALGELAEKAGAKLGSEAWGRDLGKIGEANTRVLTRLGDAGLNVSDVFRNILVSAEPLIEWMSKGALKFSEWLKTAAQTGRETGSLGHFFEETREAMERVWHILKPLGEGLLNVGHVAKGLGNEILDSLGDAAQGWADWTKSTEGQNKLKNYFKEVKPAIFAIGRLVRNLTDDFFELGRQKGVATLIDTIRTTLLPIMTQLSGATTGWLSGFLQKMGDLRKEGVPLFDAFAVTLAEHAAQAGAAIAKALFNAFINSSVWGKLAIGGWLFSKLGGFSVLGQVIGSKLGASAGAEGASVLSSTLGKALGPALAGVGIANIITSATKGDWKDAGFEAGGALAGGVAGFFLTGGNPLGAAAGVGIGSVLGEAASGLFHTEKKLAPLQERLAETTRNLADALRDQKHASEATAGAQEAVKEAQQRVKHTTASLLEAENDLDHARKTRGAGSLQAIRTEERVKTKREGNKKATEELQFAEEVLAFNRKAEGRSIAQVVHDSTLKVAADKQRLEGIKRLIQTEGFSTEASEKWTRASKKYTEDLATRNEALKQARHRNAEWATSLEEMTTAQHKFGQFGGALVTQIENLKKNIVDLRKRGAENGGPMNPLNKSLQDAKGELRTAQSRLLNLLSASGPKLKTWALEGGGHIERLGGSFESLSGTVSESVETIQKNVSGMLKSFGIGHVPKFTVKYLHQHAQGSGKKYLDKLPEFATGGLAGIVPGNSTGDRHVLSVDGRPTAKLESGEGIFIGNSRMMAVAKAANDAVPRFQTGGLAKRAGGGLVEPKLEGQGASLRRLGQAAIHKVVEGARSVLAKHRPDAGAPNTPGYSGPAIGPAGTSMYKGILMATWVRESLEYAAKHGSGDPQPTSGYRSHAQNVAEGRDYTSEHEFTQYPRGAVDFGGMYDEPAAKAAKMAVVRATSSFKYPLLAPIGFVDDGHASGTGHQRGGFLGLVKRLQKGGFAGSGYTVKGIAASIQQMRTAAEIQEAGDRTIAPHLARVAAMMAATQESNMGSTGNTFQLIGDFEGVSPSDSAFKQAVQWFTKGYYDGPVLGAGGGIEKSHKSNDPGLIAQEVEGSAYPTLYEQWKPEGQKWTDGWSAGGGEAAKGATGSTKETTKEQVPGTYKGVKARDRLNLGPMPKALEDINAQIKELGGKDGNHGLVAKYRSAAEDASKNHKPATAKAIRENLALIRARLRGLQQRRTALRITKVKKHLTERFRKATERFGAYGRTITGAQEAYEGASQFAGQVVSLEPQQPEIPVQQKGESDKKYEERQEASERDYVARYTAYIEQKERPAYATVLERAADWRNDILKAELYGFGKGQPSVTDSQTAWERQTRSVDSGIRHIRAFAKKVMGRKDAWVKGWESEKGHAGKHPKSSDYPSWLKRQLAERAEDLKEKLPILKMKDTQLRAAIQEARELFFPGGQNRLGPNGPFAKGVPAIAIAGTGSLEEQLKEVQGVHKFPDQHGLLAAAQIGPPNSPGRLGGAIWDLNETIEGLGLKVSSALHGLERPAVGGKEEEDTERDQILEDLLRQANQRLAVKGALEPVLNQFERTYPVTGLPFAGTFHSGGTVDVAGGGDAWAHVRDAEHILTPQQMAALTPADGSGGGEVMVNINGHINQEPGDTRDLVEVLERSSKAAEWVRRVHRTTQRGTSVGGSGRAWRP